MDVNDGTAARGVDIGMAVAQGHHGDAALAPAVLAVEGLDLLRAKGVLGVVLDALVEHVRVVEVHGLLPRRERVGPTQHVPLAHLLRGVAHQAGDVLNDGLGDEKALRVAERAHSGVRGEVGLHAVDLDVEVATPLVDGGDGLGELQEQKARKVVRAAGVAPRADLHSLDAAVALVADLVLDLEAVAPADGDLLHLRVIEDLHRLLGFVRGHGGRAGHGHIPAVLHSEGAARAGALHRHKRSLAVEVEHARDLGAAEVWSLRGGPKCHTAALLRRSAGRLLLHGERMLADDVCLARDAQGGGQQRFLHSIEVANHGIGVREAGFRFDGVVEREHGPLVRAGDLHLHQASCLLGQTVVGGDHQGHLLAHCRDVGAFSNEEHLLSRGEAGIVQARDVLRRDDGFDTLGHLGVGAVDLHELARGASSDDEVAVEGGHRHVVGVADGASREARG
mmetsp:Transcript_155735/g.497835  ORF Transcript_155735/g.497835 Transcript_155735/m.497835 type:complete len:450 (+) Transcript_155735:1300-2649(+)